MRLPQIIADNAALLLQSWTDAKFRLEQSVPYGDLLLHFAFGLAIFAAAAGVLRKPLGSWIPWIVVVVLAALNEAADIGRDLSYSNPPNYGESLKDLLMTVIPPLLWLLTARLGSSRPPKSERA